MHLLPCHRPQGPLESAPRTSLRDDSAHERWTGFWCVADEGYYTLCTRDDGTEQWYRFAPEVARGKVAEARVIPLRPRSRVIGFLPQGWARRTLLFVSARVGDRAMLVGTSRRRPRSRGREGSR